VANHLCNTTLLEIFEEDYFCRRERGFEGFFGAAAAAAASSSAGPIFALCGLP
jgi:hypothetical protein